MIDQQIDISKAIEAQCAAFDADYERSLKFDVEFEGKTYQADQNSYNKMLAAIAQSEFPSEFFWLDANNNRVLMDKFKMSELTNLIFRKRFELFKELQDKKFAIRQSASIDEVFYNKPSSI